MTDREAFEAWITAPPYEREVERFGDGTAWPGCYLDIDVDLAWQSWIAAALATAPAWHPAPTVPGDWICRGKSGATYWQGTVTQEEIDAINQEEITGGGWIGRWYGPIPEDKP